MPLAGSFLSTLAPYRWIECDLTAPSGALISMRPLASIVPLADSSIADNLVTCFATRCSTHTLKAPLFKIHS
ncbi:hypothetical protein RB12813 [Rhodopirellula baltica SH 1]|uniref:Uncharacterized protein n=1 Tax=Rhodopirellula baltica (strain DSM 10527 / NCIMB 13988 / SH1) TaxID=243090 RepID=Q7UI19_RHOBA|nr:hypothetical protein RB12813 [Rhodopirellula baltica SH 1]